MSRLIAFCKYNKLVVDMVKQHSNAIFFRRLTINSRIIFDKLASPHNEKKTPYVPNREIIRLFRARADDRTREQLVMENEEYLYRNKTSHVREGDFFQPKNPEIIEKFQSTHEYIKKLYEHSKSKFHIKA